MMAERFLSIDHSTIARWVLHYGPILNQRIRREMRRPNRSWRVDETYVRVAGELGRNCQCRPSPYMNNIIEQDHRFVKKRVVTSQGFRSTDGALSSIAGYEAMNIIRKGQIRWLAKGDVVGQKRFIERIFGIAA